MSDVSDKQERLEALKKARDSGALIVRHGETSHHFRSLSEIERIIAALEAEIAGLEGTTRRSPRYLRQAGKGL